jgi:hypothetical protein
LTVLAPAAVGYPLAPVSEGARQVWYDSVAVAALVLAVAGLIRAPVRHAGWSLTLLGFAGLVAGELIWTLDSTSSRAASRPHQTRSTSPPTWPSERASCD